ncbi:hypothetical protein K9U40_10240 [Xanthobacter autotrophicus]|uniref:phage minor head protein n=1 Tax=Xanthobacter TaxID=279 RepID=UPI0024ABB67A|nr:phage minor head protein [Xanthobacter autotrophicus]MDI4664704.1 hypothetical protein [Xanthobacter autotrophicus]
MATTLSALDLPFEEAIAFLRQKANITSQDYTDVWGRANVKSFTVAGAGTQALVDDFRSEVAKALEKGTSLQEFRKSFDAIVTKHGWDHTGTPGWRSRIIFETNLGMAYSAGRYAQQTEPETLAAFPFWQYVHSGALHPRIEHKGWDGTVLRADDPWWSTHYPPNGWHCGCRTRPVSARGLARMGRSGPDKAPRVEMVEHVIRKTGEVVRVPKGIDPGFDYNVGQEWTGRAPQIPANATLKPRAAVPALPEMPKTPAGPARPRVPDDELATVLPAGRPHAGTPIPPRQFASLAEADDTLAAEAAEWAASLSREERYAVAQYRGSAGFLMNELLRTGASHSVLGPQIEQLTTALERSRLKMPVRVWRGVSGGPALRLQVGDVVPEAGFFSATVDARMAAEMAGAEGVVIEIDLPAGARAAYINHVPRVSAEPEYEMLMPPRRRLRAISRVGNRIKVEVLDD